MSEILQTKVYSKFKFMPTNRQIDHLHVQKLVASLTLCNMMADDPVLVDKDMNIQDGQHRVKAAEICCETVFYKIVQPLTSGQLIAKQISKVWSLKDYFHHHLTNQHPEYVKLNQIMNEFDITMQIAMLFSDVKEDVRDHIKQNGKRDNKTIALRKGLFKIKDIEEIRPVMEKIKQVQKMLRDLKISYRGSFAWMETLNFASSLIAFFRYDEVDFETFLKKLSFKIGVLGPRLNSQHYLKMWVDVHNYRSKSQIELPEMYGQ